MQQSWGYFCALCGPLAASAEKAAAEHAVEVTPFKGPSGEHVSAQHSRLVPFPPCCKFQYRGRGLAPLPPPEPANAKPGTLSIRANHAFHASKRLLPGC